MKRKLFSQKDGTTIGEDLKEIFETEKNKLWDLVQNFGEPAEKIIDFLRLVNEKIQEGTPTDLIIDKVLEAIPGHADEAIYKFIQDHLGEWIEKAQEAVYLMIDLTKQDIPVGSLASDYEALRHKKASVLLQDYLNSKGKVIERHESDYTVQAVYNMTR